MIDHKVIQYFNHFLSLRRFTGFIDKMLVWKADGLLEECITTPATSDNCYVPKCMCIHNSKIAVKFEGNFLNETNYLLHIKT